MREEAVTADEAEKGRDITLTNTRKERVARGEAAVEGEEEMSITRVGGIGDRIRGKEERRYHLGQPKIHPLVLP